MKSWSIRLWAILQETHILNMILKSTNLRLLLNPSGFNDLKCRASPSIFGNEYGHGCAFGRCGTIARSPERTLVLKHGFYSSFGLENYFGFCFAYHTPYPKCPVTNQVSVVRSMNYLKVKVKVSGITGWSVWLSLCWLCSWYAVPACP